MPIYNEVTTLEKAALKASDYDLVLYYKGTSDQWKQLLTNNSSTSTYLERYTVHCADGDSYPYGTIGGVTWEFDSSTGTLTFSGEGAIPNYYYSHHGGVGERPWNSFFFEYAKHIVIGDGITDIGEYAFSGCSSLTSITIPDSVEWIESGAFRECSNFNC